MTSLFPAQRAAEEFDSVLDGRASVAVAERYAGLAATAQVLRDQPEVMPRAEFVADLRERLMAAAATEMVPAAPVVRRAPSTSRRNRRLGTVAAALVIVGGSAGMAAAASGALPGEPLYPVKRGIEQVTIAAHVGDASKGSALLGQADTRLGEVQRMLASGHADPALVTATTQDFESSANAGAEKLFSAYQSGGSSADITTVRDFTSSAMSQVGSMAGGADPSQAGALRDAADTLADIDHQAATLCASCGGSTLTPPSALAAGAGAAAVTNLIARPLAQVQADLANARAAQAAQAAQAKTRLQGLQDAAQGKADALGSASTPGSDVATAVSQPLRGTINSAGQLVPSLTQSGGSAVNNLVGGLTGTVSSVTGGAGGGSSGLADTAKGTGAAVSGTVDGVTGTVNGTVKGLTNGLDSTLNPDK
ncbi:MAG: hypothetical protein JOZ82_02905 [Marmoricola sp.]|nr:hypothetical protein [Marmoricola sp.]